MTTLDLESELLKINLYKDNAENAEINALVEALGLDKNLLLELLKDSLNEGNLNRFDRFDALKATVDRAKTKVYFEAQERKSISPFGLNIKIDQYLKDFVMR